MRNLTDHLAGYAAYHRDQRNIATHLVGIPMIVAAVEVLLARPGIDVGTLHVSVAAVLSAAAALFYLRLDLRLGFVMTVLLALLCWAAMGVARLPTGAWLGIGLGLFAIGWAIQFVGHVWEGRKPAFLDDLFGLLIGPLFIVAEIGFAMGFRAKLQRTIEHAAGPTRRA